MEKWRKKIGLAVLASAALLAFAPNVANADRYYGDQCCDPCDYNNNCCDCGCGGEFAIDFLWWKPSIDHLDFATEVENTGSSSEPHWHARHRSFCPDWEPGVRLAFRMPRFYCDLGLAASYTFIEPTKDHRHHCDSGLWVNYPGMNSGDGCYDRVRAKWELTYHEWDILVGYDISCNQCAHFRPFVGVAGLNIQNKIKIHCENESSSTHSSSSSDEADRIHHNNDFWGVGLRAGAEYQYLLSDCLRFFAIAHGSILAGKHENGSHGSSGDGSGECHSHNNEHDCIQLVPGYHIGTGFAYNTCVCNWDLSFRIGYEFLVWHNLKAHRRFHHTPSSCTGCEVEGASLANSSRNDRIFGFQGLFIGFGVGF